LPFWRTLDVLAPGIAVLMIFVGFAHLSSGDAFGSVSTLPFAINLWGAQRHPTQIYEIVAGVSILLVLLRISAKTPFDGFLSLVYILLAGISRFVLEAFRGDSVILSGSIRSAQAISLIVVLGALIALHRLARNTSLVT
jgi:phosphatidylglycerol:prolipoprotein diacylglycerol transferase